MVKKWVQEGDFFKTDNIRLLKVARVIASNSDGIYSVSWLHLYSKSRGLLAVESVNNGKFESGDSVAESERELYTQEEIREIETGFYYVDSSQSVRIGDPVEFEHEADSEAYFNDWKHETCQCDGGVSSYSVRTIARPLAA